MADNIELDAGSGGATIRTDDDGSAQWQYVKIAFGADNTQTIVGSISSNPFPVALSATDNAVLDAIQTAVEIIDNTVLVDDAAFTPATTSVSMAGFTFDDATPDSVDEGDAGAARMSANRNVYVTLRDAAGNERGLNVNASGEIAVDASGTAVPVTDNGGALTVDWAGTAPPIGAGTEATALKVTIATDSTGVLSVDDNGGALTVDNAGTFATQVDGDDLTALQLIDNIVEVEDTAHSTGDSGVMPLAVRNDTLGALAGTDGDYAPVQVNASGAVYVQEGAAMDVSAATVTVDWAGTAPPIGGGTEAAALRVTIANNSTGVVSVDDGGGALTVDNGGTFAVQADSVIPGTGATNLGKAVDSAVGATDTGVAMLGVRDDELAAQAADADYVNLRTDQFGRLRVTNIGDSTSVAQYAIIDAASSGNNTIQAAAGAGIKIKVLAAFLVSAGTVNVRFESAADGTALTGQMNLVANTGFVLPYNPEGWFETVDNELLNLELSAAVSVDGCITYVED